MNKLANKFIFTSDRLGFRTWHPDDLEPYREMNTDTEVMKYFPKDFWLDKQGSQRSIDGFMEHYHKFGFTYYAVDLLESQEFIGFIGMKTISYEIFFAPAVDIGWRLGKKFWGKGYATEGALRCRDYFFKNFTYDRLVSLTPIRNMASWNVMEKIGMSRVQEFAHPIVDQDHQLSQHVLYELRRNDI